MIIDFPPALPEEVRIQVCKMLDEKDQEIKNLYKEIIVLENKIERFNGGLTWKEAENLKTQVGINNSIILQIYEGLANFNLRAKQEFDPKSSNSLDVKIYRIKLRERFSIWLKSLIKWEFVRKSSN